jgi:hypothetical protein
MDALNEQVSRIGAVAGMISEIASRTNLPPLFSEISRSFRKIAWALRQSTHVIPAILQN